MPPTPEKIDVYHIFLASPGDMGDERRLTRKFFDEYNRTTARHWGVRFEVIDWENYATIGVGRPQELITKATLERYRTSLALVVGLMGQRFGEPTGEADSGTEEEFNWAFDSYQTNGFPEIKWFFRRIDRFNAPSEPAGYSKHWSSGRKSVTSANVLRRAQMESRHYSLQNSQA